MACDQVAILWKVCFQEGCKTLQMQRSPQHVVSQHIFGILVKACAKKVHKALQVKSTRHTPTTARTHTMWYVSTVHSQELL